MRQCRCHRYRRWPLPAVRDRGPSYLGNSALRHFIAPFEKFMDLLTGQPFAAMDTIEVMEYDLEDFDLGDGSAETALALR